jgi:endogenous inhibitor of DNA gyrase (YacG/DUF329 family)
MTFARVDANQPEIVAALRKIGAIPICLTCGTPCGPDRKGRPRKYCSRVCVGKAVGNNASARIKEGSLRPHTCANCGKNWRDYYEVRKFCSRKCFGEYRKENYVSPLIGTFRTDETKLKLSLATKNHMAKYGSRRDKNHPEIVAAFKKLGCDVIDMAELGNGCPDIAVYCRNTWHVIEIKNPETKYGKRGLSNRQKTWAASANAPIYVLRHLSEVARFVNGDCKDLLHVVESVEQAIQIITGE